MSTTLQLLLILLFIQCFTPKLLSAQILSITDTTTLNYTVIQSQIYQDNTILVRLNSTGECSENQVVLRLINPDGTIVNTTVIKNDNIPTTNFCNSTEIEGGILLDGIRIFALKPSLILLTYFCNIEGGTANTCGQLINWVNGNIGNQSDFGPCTDSSIVIQNQVNSDGEFLRACYSSGQRTLTWTRYTIDKNSLTINPQDSNTISNFNGSFSLGAKYLFPTKGGGYGIVTYRSVQLDPSVPISAFYLDFVPPLLSSTGFDMSGPFQLYKPTSNLFSFNITKCGNSYVGLGYSCLLYLNNNLFVNIDFLDSGSILTTDEFPFNNSNSNNLNNVVNVESLYYGGYVIVVRDPSSGVTGYIYSNDGRFIDNWRMPLTTDAVNILYTGNIGVFTNNTIWAIGNSAQGVKLVLSPLTNVVSTDTDAVNRLLSFGNPFIDSVSIRNVAQPNFNTTLTIPTSNTFYNISIRFVNLIELSNGNVSIWQTWSDSNQDILRQSFSGSPSNQYVRLRDDSMTVDITVFDSTFNVPGAQYYIEIDNGFVKDLRTGQDLLGIRKNSWILRTETNTQDTGTGSASAIIRLTPEGTSFYKLLSNSNKIIFSNNLTAELSRIIPIEQTRLVTSTHYQFDTDTQMDQLLFRVNINVANNGGLVGVVNSWRVVRDLNTLIRNKDFTGVSRGVSTNMLDNTFGSDRTPNLWEKYRWILIGIAVILIVLLVLFGMASKAHKGRNYVLFIFSILIIDFGLDVAFVILHGQDLKWLYPTSVVFLAFPILINSIVTFMVITKETSSYDNKKEFRKWWRRNSKTALFFTLFSSIDIEGLNIISSGYAGYDRFNAPISDKSSKRILLVNGAVKILEDIPQFIIYVLYQVLTVVPTIIPILALSTCSVIIVIKSINVIGFGLCYPPPRSYYSLERHNKAETKKKLVETGTEYKHSDSPPKLFSNNDTPDSTIGRTDGNGEATFMGNQNVLESIKNLPVKTVGIPVAQSITKVEEGDESGRTGDIRRSDTGIIGSIEGIIPESGRIQEETTEDDDKDKPVDDPIEVIESGNTGDNTMQGPSGENQSRFFERIDVESEPPPQGQQHQEQEQPSSHSSIKKTFARSFSNISGGSRKGSQGSKKGKGREDDDQKDQEKKDDG